MAQVAPHSPARTIGYSVALFFAGLLLSSFSSKHPSVANAGHMLVSEIVTPVQDLIGFVERSTQSVWEGYFALVGVRTENEELKGRLAALEAENSRLLEFESENLRLRKLMGLTEELSLEGVAANVIGYDPSTWVKAVTIDRGSDSGIAVGQSVVEGKGVVGHVVKVSRTSSKVLLLSDHASSVDSIVQRTRARGVVEGSGVRLAKMNYVLEREDVKIGDRVITSGFDGIFPKGLFVGVVSDVDPPARRLFRRIEIEPAADFAKLENVFVISKILREIPIGTEPSKEESK